MIRTKFVKKLYSSGSQNTAQALDFSKRICYNNTAIENRSSDLLSLHCSPDGLRT